MNKISILGCGWLGTKVALYLQKSGFAVKGSATLPEKETILNKIGISSSLIVINNTVDTSIIDTDFFECDTLIISIKPNRRQTDSGLFENQIKVVAQLAESKGVKQLILLSSTSVYGDYNQIVDEQSDLNPIRPSGYSLAKAEQILLKATAFKTAVLRLGGLIGYNRTPFEALKQHKATGNLYVPVNLVHADDVILIIHAILNKEKQNEIFNVVTNRHPLRVQYYIKAFYALGVLPQPFNVAEAHNFKVVSNEKVKNELNYTFRLNCPTELYDYDSLVST